jgi:hypothetical protein
MTASSKSSLSRYCASSRLSRWTPWAASWRRNPFLRHAPQACGLVIPLPLPEVKRGSMGFCVRGRNRQRIAISTVLASASGRSLKSSSIAARV